MAFLKHELANEVGNGLSDTNLAGASQVDESDGKPARGAGI